MVEACAGCQKLISEQYLSTVLGKKWHMACLRCIDCGSPLSQTCFSRNDAIYCKDDFYRRFGTKCSGCMLGISPQDMVRRTHDGVFHLKCFTCCICRKTLATGEQLHVLDENKFVCKEDYLTGKCANSHFIDPYMMSDEDDMDLMEPGDRSLTSPSSDGATSIHVNPTTPMTPSTPKTPTMTIPPTADIEKVTGISIKEEDQSDDDDDKALDDDKKNDDDKGGNKRRGPRTTIKAKQLEVLKNAFIKTPKPTRHLREQLAKETSLPMRVIQVWFQNKRSKERRMKQLQHMGMRSQLYPNARKMRDMPPGMEDGYPFFNGYSTFPGQPFPGYFGPQPIGYPGLCPGMEQPLPAGGPMTADFPPMGMGNALMTADSFQQHQVMTSPDEMSLTGPGNFNDHTNSEIMAW